MSSMYDAMRRAAQMDPKFAEQLREAEENRKKTIKEETAKQRARARAEYEAKKAKEKREAAEKEKARRAKEIKILSTKLPFGYAYPFMGEYSITYGIIFADGVWDAIDAVTKSLEARFKKIPNPTEYDKEHFKLAKERLRVWQLDLSSGSCGIGEYYE